MRKLLAIIAIATLLASCGSVYDTCAVRQGAVDGGLPAKNCYNKR